MTAPGTLSLLVLISGRGSNLQALIADADHGAPYRLDAVISDNPGAAGLEYAAAAGIATAILDKSAYPDRAAFDADLSDLIAGFDPGLIALAGFMRILGSDLVRRYQGRMINIHPSLLPRFPGLHTHRRALEAGDAEHGASVHFVTEELDGGPIILQARVPILPGDDAELLAERVLAAEHRIYPQAVRWFAEGRLRLHEDRALLDDNPLPLPLERKT
jgi:phosphoribosylglycinamide formyltransferase-1